LLSKNRRATLFLYLSQYALFKESKLSGQQGQLGIDALLVQLFSLLGRMRESPDSRRPAWVNPLKEMLMDTPTDWTLVELAALNIYPVHLSREFPKHFLYNKR